MTEQFLLMCDCYLKVCSQNFICALFPLDFVGRSRPRDNRFDKNFRRDKSLSKSEKQNVTAMSWLHPSWRPSKHVDVNFTVKTHLQVNLKNYI